MKYDQRHSKPARMRYIWTFASMLMRLLITGAVMLLIQSVFAQTTFPANGPHDNREIPKAFINALIHVDPTTVIQSGTLIIVNDRIAYCGPATTLNAGVEVVDLKGKHIYPAFIDLFSHYGIQEIPKRERGERRNPQYERSENRPTTWNDALKPEYDAVSDIQFQKEASEKYLQMGVGAVLTHRADGVARGTGALVVPADGLANKMLLASKVAAFYSFQKGSSQQRYPSSLMGAIALLRQTYLDASWYAGQGITKERNIGLQAWNENQLLPQIFVLTEKNDLPRAQQLGEEFGIQYILKTEGDEYQRMEQTVHAGAKLIVPINFPKAYNITDPYDANLVSLQELKHWESAPANPALLSANGLDFCITTDGHKTAKDFLQNLRKSVANGLTREAALQALTTNPARFIGAETQLGTLSLGKWANFFIASDDIFKPQADLLETWAMGRRYTHEAYVTVDARGKYNLNLENNFYTLIVAGTLNKPTAKAVLISGADTLKKEVQLSLANQLVTFSFEPNDANYKGVLRFSGNVHKESRIWEGQFQKADGTWVPWTAVRQQEKAVAEKTKKDSIQAAEQQRIFLPNRAFGLDSLPKTETILFSGATIWTCEAKGVIENGQILIRDGKIVAVGQNLNMLELLGKKAAAPRAVNLKGKHITPGLIDEHSHIAISRGVNEGSKASTAEVRIGDAINPDDINIYRQLAGGVTTVQQLHGSANPIGGQSSLIKLRWGRNASEMRFENAPGFIKFALGENVKQSNWGDVERVRYPQTRMGVEQVFYDHFIRAREYDLSKTEVSEKPKKSARSGQSKLSVVKPKKKDNQYSSLFRTDLELECLAEILKEERFITCHSYVQSEINMLMHVADSMKFKVNTFTHILEGYKLADKMKAHGAGGSTFSDWWAYKFEVNDAIPYNAALMHQMGVTVAMNSDDAEMARRLNQEAAKAVKYGGVSETEAIKMVTLNPARLLRIDDRVGSLAPGKDADFVIWSGPPLSVYARAEQTYVDGACYFSLEKNEQLMIRDQQERARIIAKMAKVDDKSDNKKPSKNPNDKQYHCDDVDEEI
jgi:imidazolonepropionase-like amidohydrolase